LPTIYKILSDILLSRLNVYVDDMIGYHECGFRRKRSPTGHIFCIRHILRTCKKNTKKQWISYL